MLEFLYEVTLNVRSHLLFEIKKEQFIFPFLFNDYYVISLLSFSLYENITITSHLTLPRIITSLPH